MVFGYEYPNDEKLIEIQYIMKQIKIIILLTFFFMVLSSCEKEVVYPTSIIGNWRFIGNSHSEDVNKRIKYEGQLLLMEITKDSLFSYEGDIYNLIIKSKIELTDNGIQGILTYNMYYTLPDSSIGTITISSAYEIKKDLLIFKSLDGYYQYQFGFYKSYP
jgi:hypothetical protein